MAPFPAPWERCLTTVDTDVHTVVLHHHVREHACGWVCEKVFVTSEPLEKLMWMRGFRLPGESADQAEMREDYR